jgi:hypothetical protein
MQALLFSEYEGMNITHISSTKVYEHFIFLKSTIIYNLQICS